MIEIAKEIATRQSSRDDKSNGSRKKASRGRFEEDESSSDSSNSSNDDNEDDNDEDFVPTPVKTQRKNQIFSSDEE